MTQTQLGLQEPTIAVTQSDQLSPIPVVRQDTGELVWLVQSRSHPSCTYVVMRVGDGICCPCPHYQHKGRCAHAAAVHLHVKANQQESDPEMHAPQHVHPPVQRQERGETRSAAERQQREDALRRERALLWTDDKPF